MIKRLPFLLLIFCFWYCTKQDDSVNNNNDDQKFYRGMDLSFLPENEALGVVFKDENNQNISDNYEYLSRKGVNLVRIRLWVNHPQQAYNLNVLKEQVIKVKAAGMDYLLDFHYSDTWADPGNQQTPIVWENLNATDLSIAIGRYTATVIRELKNIDAAPEMVQIGNETNNGFLWPVGQIYSNGNENFDNYVLITKAAIDAVKNNSPESKIMIHRAGIVDSAYFFDQLISRGVSFDIAGLSYYP